MKTIAVIPGSFKLPHRGHYEMVEHYSKLADEVYVIISNPGPNSKSIRKIGDCPVYPEYAKSVFEDYVTDLDNVHINIAEHPSPIASAFDLIKSFKDTKVILGRSNKETDQRWISIKSYMAKNNPSVEILDIDQYIFHVESEPISASDFRSAINEFTFNPYIPAVRKFLPKHLLEKLDENS